MVLLGLTSRRKCVWLGSVVAEVLEVLVAWRSRLILPSDSVTQRIVMDNGGACCQYCVCVRLRRNAPWQRLYAVSNVCGI